ncbi:MAG TPA: YceI family protein [Thermodesulfovibrionales bacterium]|nr:YceI family protein [Thermodesulfovibrionales bacterium]
MGKWIIDPDHSVAAFVVRHMMITNVRGQFNRLSGSIVVDPDNMDKSDVEVSIDASGICTGISKRDEHLRSADFFDIEKYPQITFRSRSVKSSGMGQFEVSGLLTVHGVSREVVFSVKSAGPERSPEDETSMGFAATTGLDRRDFDMQWNVPLNSGGLMVGNEISIYLDIEADLANG